MQSASGGFELDKTKNEVIFEEVLEQPSRLKTVQRRTRPQTAKPLNSRSGRNRQIPVERTATNGTSNLNMLEDSGNEANDTEECGDANI